VDLLLAWKCPDADAACGQHLPKRAAARQSPEKAYPELLLELPFELALQLQVAGALEMKRCAGRTVAETSSKDTNRKNRLGKFIVASLTAPV
jgi:hypothetical protein